MTATKKKSSKKAGKKSAAKAAVVPQTRTAISVGDQFGYRKVVAVNPRNVSYINLNGRTTDGETIDESARKVYVLPVAEFKEKAKLA